jgi:hypothetical protein
LHALFTGDYVTPSTGEYAGKLGPWAGLNTVIKIAAHLCHSIMRKP